VHATSEEKSVDSKDNIHDELDQVFLSFSEIPNENSVRRREYFQPDNCE